MHIENLIASIPLVHSIQIMKILKYANLAKI